MLLKCKHVPAGDFFKIPILFLCTLRFKEKTVAFEQVQTHEAFDIVKVNQDRCTTFIKLKPSMANKTCTLDLELRVPFGGGEG